MIVDGIHYECECRKDAYVPACIRMDPWSSYPEEGGEVFLENVFDADKYPIQVAAETWDMIEAELNNKYGGNNKFGEE